LKISRYRGQQKKLKSCFNDILGLRIVVSSYNTLDSIPDYFKVVDMRNGKANDDGYRGIHLYYSKSNNHYPIEIQIWEKRDEQFINWCHKYTYKTPISMKVQCTLRKWYDIGKIKTELDFQQALETLKSCETFNNYYKEA
jgi:putative GTP pyrophosphokinase